ncbi:MAG: aminotransferase class I/II-fold pyridoxal phosphate-dependent enzyme [Nitrospira sp.]|nr:aminotransferase class I/II-fold pyridoxal phosphate-dependent enzyme [Nitrospira sp.]MCP9442325.1 aminotransferase class I/II-fold pyridoxal phosphate-dependent enzyme [Nitrospira sp.]
MPVSPNPRFQSLEAYEITPQEPWQIYEDYSVTKLDWNEGDFVPDFVKRTARRLLSNDEYYAWYPDCAAIELTKALAGSLGVSVMNVLTFPGSDVALESLCRVYLGVGERVLIPVPTYENLFTFAASAGGELVFVSLKPPFEFSAASFIADYRDDRPKLIYLVSPNNPCGYVIARSDVRDICRAFPDALVILDQAYVDFSPDASCVDLIRDCDNLAITRTFSKAFSLAGMRLGYIVADHGILKQVAKIRNGKNLGMLAQKLGVELLKRQTDVQQWIRQVVETRDWLSDQLTALGVMHSKSHANFILFVMPDPKYALAEFKRHGVYVRDKSKAVPNGLRVTITTRQAAEQFLAVLKQLVSR